jgi:hypothetical protein
MLGISGKTLDRLVAQEMLTPVRLLPAATADSESQTSPRSSARRELRT